MTFSVSVTAPARRPIRDPRLLERTSTRKKEFRHKCRLKKPPASTIDPFVRLGTQPGRRKQPKSEHARLSGPLGPLRLPVRPVRPVRPEAESVCWDFAGTLKDPRSRPEPWRGEQGRCAHLEPSKPAHGNEFQDALALWQKVLPGVQTPQSSSVSRDLTASSTSDQHTLPESLQASTNLAKHCLLVQRRPSCGLAEKSSALC